MNKYQEALDWLMEGNDSCGNEWDLLQELVDKTIHMKPCYPTEYPIARCPKCFQSLGDNNFCRNCGQAILWEE